MGTIFTGAKELSCSKIRNEILTILNSCYNPQYYCAYFGLSLIVQMQETVLLCILGLYYIVQMQETNFYKCAAHTNNIDYCIC